MTNEAKVGAFTILGIIIFALVYVFLTGFHFSGNKMYGISVGFQQVLGLNPGANVCFAGVSVGEVTDISTEGSGVRVDLKLPSYLQMPKDSMITITSVGVMGEKFINIVPAKDNGMYIKEGDYIIGYDEQGIESMMDKINKALTQVHILLLSMNEIFASQVAKDSVIESSKNIREITENIRTLSKVFATSALENQGDIRLIIENLSAITTHLRDFSSEAEKMMQDVSGDGSSGKNLKIAIKNLAQTSVRVENMARNLEGVVADQKTKEDLRATIQNARHLSDKANSLLHTFSDIDTKVGAEVLYSGKDDYYETNVDVKFSKKTQDFLNLGIVDIGEDNLLSMQVGRQNGALATRAGIFENKLGIGVDGKLGERFSFSLDAYQLNNAILKLKSKYLLTKDTELVWQIKNLNHKDQRANYIGLRRTF